MKIDFSKLAHKALGFLINEGETEAIKAVGQAIATSKIPTKAITLAEHNDLVEKVQSAYETISA